MKFDEKIKSVMTVNYFAYGSNINQEQMTNRCPSSVHIGKAVLNDFKLTFCGYSRKWNGSVANVTESKGDSVVGRLWQVSKSDLEVLDIFEGHPKKYVRTFNEDLQAYIYIKQSDLSIGPPSSEYLNTINIGLSQIGEEPITTNN